MSKEQRTAVDTLLRQPHPRPGSIEEVRAGFEAQMAAMAVPSGVARASVTLGSRPAVLVTPSASDRPGAILYFHGGAYVAGSPATSMTVTASLVARTGIRAYSLDYRLAPEHPFPAAIDDAVAAYRELLSSGLPADGIAFAGDSAGGGLSVAACLAARTAGLPLPAAVVTFSAGLDATYSGPTMETKEGIDPLFTRAALQPGKALYVGDADPAQPLLSPALTADLTGFPPMLLQVGGNEVLLSDSVRLADRAQEAGVSVVLDVTADVPHVFQCFATVLDEADEALDRAAAFLTQRLP